MSTITDPIILDSTGQAIKNSIDLLAANINRTASNIPYDSNLTIKAAIDGKVSKTGDTMTGNLNVKPDNTLGAISLGKGSNSSEYGVVQMYDDASHWLNIMPSSQTDNRMILFPDKTGTVALTSDVPLIENITSLFNYDTTYNVWATGQNAVAKSGYRFLGFQVLATNTNSPAVPACSFQNGYARIRGWDANYTFIATAFYVKI